MWTSPIVPAEDPKKLDIFFQSVKQHNVNSLTIEYIERYPVVHAKFLQEWKKNLCDYLLNSNQLKKLRKLQRGR